MNSIKTANQISNLTLRKWITSPKIYILFILMASLIIYPYDSIADVLIQNNLEISPFIFPFFLINLYFRLAITFGVILLFCDAPFKTTEQLFVISRANKTTWVFGQILYIIKGTLIYYGFIFICSIIAFLPQITFIGDWGEGINFLSKQQFLHLGFPIEIIEFYTPFWAVIHAFFLNVLIGILIALIMFWLNTITAKFVGATICVVLTLAPLMALMFGQWFMWVVPTSLTAIHMLDSYGIAVGIPKLWYAYVYLIGLNLILVWLSVKATRKNLLGGAV